MIREHRAAWFFVWLLPIICWFCCSDCHSNQPRESASCSWKKLWLFAAPQRGPKKVFFNLYEKFQSFLAFQNNIGSRLMGVFFARPETATNILENGLFDIPRFYEGVSKTTFSTFRDFTRGCSVMPKTATNILENDLFDIPRFYEGVFRYAEKRDKSPRNHSFRLRDFFDKVEFFWVRFTAKETLF